ncbi:hypothetical protein Adeg_0710 [Ammonifex degensii KC4]|uniref:Three-Cys-motif partner protein TcmP n=1 Tax=Ammonifex degensii (strain DSM 10501 / KC4) TaxID=429009 RepID=C9RC80_AMMDK|nr:three-Cys-motif partner protein TcmP [Ammonifex degensii]ACX51857.1 hypothetical protein Adeg_0710 [Ammonifex degensii KC4]
MKKKLIWRKAPHTEAKHKILDYYLKAWIPKLGTWNERILIIDGFAGPGEYDDRKPGSPIVILDAVTNHILRNQIGKIGVFFIEGNNDRANHLENLLIRRYSPLRVGKSIYELNEGRTVFAIIKGKFSATLGEMLDITRTQGVSLPPCFAFIDPFGPSGIPMELISGLMECTKAEVLINFPVDSVNRFLGTPAYENTLDALYGCEDWRKLRMVKGVERRRRLRELYISQLKSNAGAKYTLHFTMRNARNRELYYLIFATKHWHGLDVMKQAMWKIAPDGSFQFSDYTHNPEQPWLFPPEPDWEELANLIWKHFRGQEAVPPEEIERWTVIETIYASNHVRRALTLLEEKGKLCKYEAAYSGRGWVKLAPYKKKRAFPNSKVVVDFSAD